MSTAFTSPRGRNMADLVCLNELRQALWERASAASRSDIRDRYGTSSAYTPIISGDTTRDIALLSLWQQMQSDLEALVPLYVDHTQPEANPGQYAGLSAIPMFTLAAWRAAAGLYVGDSTHSGGFCRLSPTASWPSDPTDPSDPSFTPDPSNPSDPAYPHGIVQAGDVCYHSAHGGAAWIVSELQRGLLTLKWTRDGGNGPLSVLLNSRGRMASYQWSYSNPDMARQACEDLWTYKYGAGAWDNPPDDSLPWHRVTGVNLGFGLYNVLATREQISGDLVFNELRHYGQVRLNSIPVFNPHAADLYLLPADGSPFGSGTPPTDPDGLGMTIGHLWFFETFHSESVNARDSSVVGQVDTQPLDAYGLSGASVGGTYLVLATGPHWVLKWSFTQSNL